MDTIISDADYRSLEETAQQSGNNKYHFKNLIQRIRIVQEDKLPKTTVRLNSLVLLWHSFLKKVVKFRIVLPHHEDLHQRNISVFAPISMAILGRRESEEILVRLGGIEKELRIIKVINR